MAYYRAAFRISRPALTAAQAVHMSNSVHCISNSCFYYVERMEKVAFEMGEKLRFVRGRNSGKIGHGGRKQGWTKSEPPDLRLALQLQCRRNSYHITKLRAPGPIALRGQRSINGAVSFFPHRVMSSLTRRKLLDFSYSEGRAGHTVGNVTYDTITTLTVTRFHTCK